MPFVNLESLGGLPLVACVVYAEYHDGENLIQENRLSYDVQDAVPQFLSELGVQAQSWHSFLRDCLSMKPEMSNYAERRFHAEPETEHFENNYQYLCPCRRKKRKQKPPEECLYCAARVISSWSERWPSITVQHHIYDEYVGKYCVMFRDLEGQVSMKQFHFHAPQGSADLGAFMLLGSRDRIESDLEPMHLVKVLTGESHRVNRQRTSVQALMQQRLSQTSARSVESTTSSETSLRTQPVVLKVASKAAADGLDTELPEGGCVSFSMEDEVKMSPSSRKH